MLILFFILDMKTFEIIKGHRAGSTLLWVPAEQQLYVKECTRNGKEEFICYQTILRKNVKADDMAPYCTAGAVVMDGVLIPKKRAIQNIQTTAEFINIWWPEIMFWTGALT